MSDPILTKIIYELKNDHHCHTAIFYGSRARGDFTPDSDYDILGIKESGDKQRIVKKKNGFWIDAFVFPESEIKTPGEQHLYMADGRVLFEKDQIGTQFLNTLKELENKRPESLPPDEKSAHILWYSKMLERAKRGDAEGNFRKIWSLHAILEDLFVLQNERYPGPKKALQLLSLEYPSINSSFEKALTAPENLKLQEQLIHEVLTQVQLPNNPDHLRFETIDLQSHSKTCIEFRKDSFFSSFGNLEDFEKQCGPDGSIYLDWLKSKQQNDPMSCVHVWHGKRIIGQLEMGRFKPEPDTGYVNLYYLTPAMRGNGLSKSLDQYTTNHLKLLGYKKARLSVSPTNLRALKYYIKMGWTDIGPRPEHPEVNLMEKTL